MPFGDVRDYRRLSSLLMDDRIPAKSPRRMTKHSAPVVAIWLASLAVATAAAAPAEPSPAAARGLFLGGKYAEAADVYQALAERAPAAAVGWARCLEAVG